jgi:hypothetical protein
VALRAPLVAVLAAAPPGHDVVHVQTDAGEPVRALALEGRHQHRQRLDQMGRELDEQRALEQRLAHQAEVEVLQVAQAAVDQLGGTARGAGGEVGALDQGHAVAARGGVERDAGPGDATADDGEVERVPLERCERVCARDHGRNVT